MKLTFMLFLVVFLSVSSFNLVVAQVTNVTEEEIIKKRKHIQDSIDKANQPLIIKEDKDAETKNDDRVGEKRKSKYYSNDTKKLWPSLLNPAPFPIAQFSAQVTGIFLNTNGMYGSGFMTRLIGRTRPLRSLNDVSTGPMAELGQVITHTEVVSPTKDTSDYVGTTNIAGLAYSIASYNVDAYGSEIFVFDMGVRRVIAEGENKLVKTKQVSWLLTANAYYESQSSEVFGSLVGVNVGAHYSADATISGANDTAALKLETYDLGMVYGNIIFTGLSLPVPFGNKSGLDKYPLAYALDFGVGGSYGLQKKAMTYNFSVGLRIHKRALTIANLEAKVYTTPKEASVWRNYTEVNLTFYPLNIYYAFK